MKRIKSFFEFLKVTLLTTNSGKRLVAMIISIIALGIAFIISATVGGNKAIVNRLIAIIWLLLVVGIMTVFFVKEYSEWDRQVFNYPGNDDFKDIDDQIKDACKNGKYPGDVYTKINEVYNNIHSLEQLLVRRHFLKNKEKAPESFKELMIAVMITLLFQYSGSMIKEIEINSSIVGLIVDIIIAAMIVVSVMMAYIKPTYSKNSAFYGYELILLEEKLLEKQRSFRPSETGNEINPVK